MKRISPPSFSSPGFFSGATSAVVLLCLLLLTGNQTSDAFGFHSTKKAVQRSNESQLQTYQPPPPNSLQVQCDPIKEKAVAINQKPFLIRGFFVPRREWLILKHRECIDKILDQEYIYLKHADIPLSPKLPKMTTPDGKPLAMPVDMPPESGDTNGAGASPETPQAQSPTQGSTPESKGANALPSGDSADTGNK